MGIAKREIGGLDGRVHAHPNPTFECPMNTRRNTTTQRNTGPSGSRVHSASPDGPSSATSRLISSTSSSLPVFASARTSTRSFGAPLSALNSAASRRPSYSVLAMRNIMRRSGRPGLRAARTGSPSITARRDAAADGHTKEVGQCKAGETRTGKCSKEVVERRIGQISVVRGPGATAGSAIHGYASSVDSSRIRASWAAALKPFETRAGQEGHRAKTRCRHGWRCRCGEGQSVKECEWAGCVWKGDRALGGTMYVGMLGNIAVMHGKEGVLRDSVQVMSRLLGARVTKVLVLARRAGVWYSMPDMYEMALFEEDCPMRKGDLELEGRVTIRRVPTERSYGFTVVLRRPSTQCHCCKIGATVHPIPHLTLEFSGKPRAAQGENV
ncbi:hypothetical protein V8E53_004573 [Lactarius tabidus]